jgi:hypothetical protein
MKSLTPAFIPVPSPSVLLLSGSMVDRPQSTGTYFLRAYVRGELYDFGSARVSVALPKVNDVTTINITQPNQNGLFAQAINTITGVKGIIDDLNSPVFHGTCTTCHDAPNAGNHSIPVPLDIGLTDVTQRTPDMPLYTLQNKTTGEQVQTTDPGRSLLTGKWKDIARFKGPVLRALAARAPYFHNGFAKDFNAVVNFYNDRFGIGLSDSEKADLVAFLRTL